MGLKRGLVGRRILRFRSLGGTDSNRQENDDDKADRGAPWEDAENKWSCDGFSKSNIGTMPVIPKPVYCRKRQTPGQGGFSVFGRQPQFKVAEYLAVVDVADAQFDAVLAGLKRESA